MREAHGWRAMIARTVLSCLVFATAPVVLLAANDDLFTQMQKQLKISDR